MARSVCVVVLVCGLFAGSAAAQDAQNIQTMVAAAQLPPPQVLTVRVERERPPSLVPMYVSFAALQGMDYVTTTRAIRSGAGQEANPVMRGVVGNRAAFFAVKAGTTVATTAIAERMWKKHPVRAVIVMVAANATMAAVVSHNMRVR